VLAPGMVVFHARGGSMKRCEACGLNAMPGTYCSECAAELTEYLPPCPSCGNQDVSGNFCNMCAAPLHPDACPSCQSPNQRGAFCRNCGNQLGISNQLQEIGESEDTKIRCPNCRQWTPKFRSFAFGTFAKYCDVCNFQLPTEP